MDVIFSMMIGMGWNATGQIDTGHSQHAFYGICWLVLSISVLFPVWEPDLLPFTDYPVHLSLIQVSDIPGRAALIISDRFETHWFTPYVIPYQLTRLIAVVLPVEAAGRIILSIYLLATPLMLFRLFRTLGKSGLLALPAFLILFNFNLSWGFLPFLTAIPILIESVTQCVRFEHKPGVYRGIFIACLFVFLFFTHLFALMVSLFLCLSVIISAAIEKHKSALTLGFTVLPVATLVLIWRLLLHFNASDRYFLDKGIRFAPLELKFRFFPDYVISGDPGWTSRVIFFILILLICIRFIPDRRTSLPIVSSQGNPNPDTRVFELLNRNIRIGLVIGIWLCYLLCPYSWLTAVWLFHRIAFLALALTLALLPRQSCISGPLWAAAIVTICVTLCCKTTMRHNNFNEEAAAGLQVMRRIPPGKNLRYIPFNPRSSYADHNPYQHFGQYYQLHQGGFIHNPFAVLTHMPIRYSAEWMEKEAGFRPEVIRGSSSIQVDLAAEKNDYFLFRLSPKETPEIVGKLFFEQLGYLPEILYQEKEWILLGKHGVSL